MGAQGAAGPGLVWNFDGNDVVILSPSNVPGAVQMRIPVDSILRVEVMAEDGLVRN